MNNAVFFTNAGDERGTPPAFFNQLNREFKFDLDCAASPLNHKCPMYFGLGGVEENALDTDWGGLTCFLNPPYSVAEAFVAKARYEAGKGAQVVMLMPVRSETRWWHTHIWDETKGPDGSWRDGVRGRFIQKRLNFELHVPPEMRQWVLDQPLDTKEELQAVIWTTGLPKMAIERIRQHLPDEDLLDAAPFPSCVIIFERGQ